MDAYLLGDLAEQERWSRIRELIEEREPDDDEAASRYMR